MYEKNNIIAFYGWKDFLSNFHYSNFNYRGENFNSVEKFYMYYKARFFEDYDTAKKIMNETAPGNCKYLGRQVKGYDDALWTTVREAVMFNACLQKFKQNSMLGRKLLQTGDAVLVEASPRDLIWGVGLAEMDNRVFNPKHWKGQNLLGKTLMRVRDVLRHNAKEVFHDRKEPMPTVFPYYATRKESAYGKGSDGLPILLDSIGDDTDNKGSTEESLESV